MTVTTAEIDAAWTHAAALVGGEALEVGEHAEVVNPADTRHVLGQHACCGPADVDRAVRAAQDAFAGWAGIGAARRGAMMLAAAEELAPLAGSLVGLISAEVGKVPAESAIDSPGAVALLRGFAGLSALAERELDLSDSPTSAPARMAKVRREPVGPVAVISPWNTPAFLTFNMLAPALISGCPVVVKPPEVAPLAVTAMLHKLAALLPPGVVNVVPGTGAQAGAALTAHPLIRAVLFTGGVATGRGVLASAAGTVKKVSLELGGNDPAIVLDSAEVTETMLREMIAGAFSSSGQICYNIKRVYVHRRHYERFVDGMAQMLSQLVVGDPFEPGVHMGPMTTAAGHQRALRLVEDCERDGATVRRLGSRSASAQWEHGYYVDPTLVTDIAPDSELVMHEQFAPVLPVLPFDSDDEAITEANRTEYGLGSSVWSEDIDHAETVARRVAAGATFINIHRIGASVASIPFGGVKQSGLGRNHGEHSISSVTEDHAIVHIADASNAVPGLERWSDLTQGAERARG